MMDRRTETQMRLNLTDPKSKSAADPSRDRPEVRAVEAIRAFRKPPEPPVFRSVRSRPLGNATF